MGPGEKMKIIYALLESAKVISPATRTLFAESRSLGAALHGWVYARFTQRYVNFLLSPREPGSGGTSRWLADRYHGKVLTPEHARAIVVNERVIRRDLKQVLPYPAAREIVLNGPPEIAAYECVCRHARPSPCQPTMVCMVVGQPMVDLVLGYHPDKSRRLTQEEALDLLQAEHERGHVHAAWFKDAMLGRFYAICNCCKCCCGGIQRHAERRRPLSDVVGIRGADRSRRLLALRRVFRRLPVQRTGSARRLRGTQLGEVPRLRSMPGALPFQCGIACEGRAQRTPPGRPQPEFSAPARVLP